MSTTTRTEAMRLAAFITGVLVVFNTAFFFLSNLWFEDHKAADLVAIRGAFGMLTGIVAVTSFGAALAARQIGHVLALTAGAWSVAAGIGAFAKSMPLVMGFTLVIVGCTLSALTYLSYYRRSRPAWATTIAILAVFAAVDFFGAPKIRGLLHIGLWTALILPGVQIVAVIALAMVRGEYAEKQP